MTGKRFYYNTFYHADDMSRVLEYEIIDRQSYPNYPNHDEKEDIPQWYMYIGENDSGWQDMLVDLLNELHEENEQLRKNCKNYEWYKQYKNLLNENEQLKEIVLQLFDTIMELDWAKEKYCNSLIEILGEENDVDKTKQRIKEFLE